MYTTYKRADCRNLLKEKFLDKRFTILSIHGIDRFFDTQNAGQIGVIIKSWDDLYRYILELKPGKDPNAPAPKIEIVTLDPAHRLTDRQLAGLDEIPK